MTVMFYLLLANGKPKRLVSGRMAMNVIQSMYRTTGTMHHMWQRPWSWHSDGLRGLLRCWLPLPGMTVDQVRYRWPLPK